MSAYLLADLDVLDPAAFEKYRSLAPATIEAYGGRYIVRGGQTDVLEGDLTPSRLVILEFPDMSRLRAWYDSPEYRPLRELRDRAARSRFVAVEGV